MADINDSLSRFTTPEAWRSGLIRSTILGRLVERFASERSTPGDTACARLLISAPSVEARRPLLAALEETTRGRLSTTFAPALAQPVIRLAEQDLHDLTSTRLAARLGKRDAQQRARTTAADPTASESDRRAMLELIGELKDREFLDRLLELTRCDPSLPIRLMALSVLGRFDDERVAATMLAVYPAQVEAWRSRAREVLLSRTSWTRDYLAAIDRGEVPAKDLSLDEMARFATLRDPSLTNLVRKHWGLSRGPTSEERLAEIRRLNNDLRAAPGDAERGRLLFRERCAICHRLGALGETIGPDLTFANRQDRDFLLTSLVDPAGVVRKEYQLYNLETRDGRVLSGLIVEQTPDAITLADAKGERTRIARTEIGELKESDASLMPESLYKELRPDQLRDLFQFLQSERPEGRKEEP
jgi:putative heme-binding domain-containing protein